MFKGVKDAWMRRQLEGEVGGWGMQEDVFKVDQLETKEEKEDEAVDTDAADDGEKEEGGSTEEEKWTNLYRCYLYLIFCAQARFISCQ